MKRLLVPIALLSIVPLVWGANILQGAGFSRGCDECSRCGEEFCYPVPKEVTVSKHCWEIELKRICIPAVHFPWERPASRDRCDGCDGSGCDGCRAKCGKVRWVRTLKKVKYDRKKCGCDWVCAPVCDDCLRTLPADYDPRANPEVDPVPPVEPPVGLPPVGPPSGAAPPESSPLPPRSSPVTPVPSASRSSIRLGD